MSIYTKVISLCFSCFLVVVFGYQIRLLDQIDRLVSLPPPAAGSLSRPGGREPARDAVSTSEMDDLVVEVLNSLPPNKTRDQENVGYVVYDAENDAYEVSELQVIKIRSRRSLAFAAINLPDDENVVGIFHDHFRDTLPGPGIGDGGPVFRGLVSYIKDEQGSIYKIEYSKLWKTPENNNNGWRLTTLYGNDLAGQEKWRPGVVFTRYASAPIIQKTL